jgi:probable F420-dependent oxidoreductase
MNVKIGLMMFITSRTIAMVKLAREAEQRGFESLFLPEHPVLPVNTSTLFPGTHTRVIPDEYHRMLDPYIALAAAAGATQTLRLGTGISLVLERNPILTAKAIATLDRVSHGRVIFGVGSGWLKEEADIFGVDWNKRGSQLKDYMLAMKACWSEGVSDYHGTHVQFPPLICEPKPLQQPHPPVLIAGELKRVVTRVADWGNGWIPRYIMSSPEEIAAGRQQIEQLYRERGRDPATIDITLFGARTNQDEMQHWIDAGVTRLLYIIPATEEHETLSRLDYIAGKVL